MARRSDVERLDPALIDRVAGMSAGGQRWLKTALMTVKSIPLDEEERDERPRAEPPVRRAPRAKAPPQGLDELLSGKTSLEDIDQFPELAEELEGLGDIVDMLRKLGEERRKKGEQILRDEFEVDRPQEDDEDFAF